MDLQRGAVIRVNLNPTQGREQQGEARPCVVLSHTKFNEAREGMVIVHQFQLNVNVPSDNALTLNPSPNLGEGL